MTNYYRVRVRGTRRTFFVRVTAETPSFVHGIEVNSYGDEIATAKVDQRLHIMHRVAVELEPYRMDDHYAELVAC